MEGGGVFTGPTVIPAALSKGVVDDAVFDESLVPTEFIADTRYV